CVTHPQLAYLLRAAAKEHQGGERLGAALSRMPFRSSFVNAVTAGEQTGEIAARVEELQEPYRVEMERYIDMTVGTLKFVVMTILLPFFIVSTYTSLVGPIFALMEYS
ncbi:MAG: type II secretion system F family protein, partial [Alphaproteobacteria bacterium]